jgi:hypothetical protein
MFLRPLIDVCGVYARVDVLNTARLNVLYLMVFCPPNMGTVLFDYNGRIKWMLHAIARRI